MPSDQELQARKECSPTKRPEESLRPPYSVFGCPTSVKPRGEAKRKPYKSLFGCWKAFMRHVQRWSVYGREWRSEGNSLWVLDHGFYSYCFVSLLPPLYREKHSDPICTYCTIGTVRRIKARGLHTDILHIKLPVQIYCPPAAPAFLPSCPLSGLPLVS